MSLEETQEMSTSPLFFAPQKKDGGVASNQRWFDSLSSVSDFSITVYFFCVLFFHFLGRAP